MKASEIYRIIERLREECEIRDPSEKLGYLKALLDVAGEVRSKDECVDSL